MKNADEAELQLLASQPLDITVHNVQDFPQLGTLAGLLGRLICQKVQGGSRDPGEQSPSLAAALPGRSGQRDGTPVRCAPHPLPPRFSRPRGLRPGEPAGAAGRAGAAQTQAALGPLTVLSPHPARPAAATSALDTLFTPSSLLLTQVTSSSAHLSWTPAAQLPLKYLIMWRPSKGGPPREVRGGSLPAPS